MATTRNPDLLLARFDGYERNSVLTQRFSREVLLL